ncbi:MAG: hypothetical protein M3137_05055 [Actinomycetota bacterium]|nr:hypothetical protein [Actinomycetota bacterium]
MTVSIDARSQPAIDRTVETINAHGGHAIGTAADCTIEVDLEVETGTEVGQGSLQSGRTPERRSHLGRDGKPVFGNKAEQLGE